MFNFEANKKYIIICDQMYHNFLLEFKSKNPILNIKLMTEQSFVNSFYMVDEDNIVNYLMKRNNLSFNSSKRLASLVPYLAKNTAELNDLVENSSNIWDYVEEDNLGFELIKNTIILLFESDSNAQLFNFCAERNIAFQQITFNDFDIKKAKHESVFIYPTVHDMLGYIFSDIRAKCLNIAAKPEDFVILCDFEKLQIELNFFSKLFDIPISYQRVQKMISLPQIQQILNNFDLNNKIEIQKDNKDPYILKLNSIIDTYSFNSGYEYENARKRLKEVLSSTNIITKSQKSGVNISSDLSFETTKSYYVTNFVYGEFYKIYEDNNIFSDKQLEKLKINESYTKTNIDKNNKLNFISYNKVSQLCFYARHLDEKIHQSIFIDELDLNIVNQNYYNKNGLYTEKAATYFKLYDLDSLNAKPAIDYKTYNHKYSNSLRFANITRFSPSIFNSYLMCPYAYYLEKIIFKDPDPTENTYSRDFGTFFHSILEKYGKGFNYEKEFNEKLPIIKNLNNEKKVYLDFAKQHFKYTLDFMSHVDGYNTLLALPEQGKNETSELKFQKITYKSNKYPNVEYILGGSIDKVIYTKSNNLNEPYYTIVDYKTGSQDVILPKYFSIGYTIQLPLYASALRNLGGKFGGFFIQKIFMPLVSEDFGVVLTEEKYWEQLCPTGIFVDNSDYIIGFDSTAIFTKKNTFKSAEYIKKTTGGATLKSTEEVNKLFSTVNKGALYVMDSIYSLDFPISPRSYGGSKSLPCSYCKYRDICYRSMNDAETLDDLLAETGEDSEEDGNDEL